MHKKELLPQIKQFRLIGLLLFIIVAGTIAIRYLVRALFNDNPMLKEMVFSIFVQVILLLFIPILLFTFVLKKKPVDIIHFSNIRKAKPIKYVLSVLLGFFVFFMMLGVGLIWQTFLLSIGYVHIPPPLNLPEKFNIWLFIRIMFLVAFLPGICEEFIMRGGILTTFRDSFAERQGGGNKQAILLSAVTFGLYHSNVSQLLTTAMFGGLMAYVVIKTGSVVSAMIIHFINNGFGIYLEFAEKYSWFGGFFFDFIDMGLLIQPWVQIFLFTLIFAAGVCLVYLMCTKTNSSCVDGYIPGQKYMDRGFLLRLRDKAFYFVTLVISIFATVASFVWG